MFSRHELTSNSFVNGLLKFFHLICNIIILFELLLQNSVSKVCNFRNPKFFLHAVSAHMHLFSCILQIWLNLDNNNQSIQEDNLTERRHKLNKFPLEDKLNGTQLSGRKPQLKTTSKEEDLNGLLPLWMMNSMKTTSTKADFN